MRCAVLGTDTERIVVDLARCTAQWYDRPSQIQRPARLPLLPFTPAQCCMTRSRTKLLAIASLSSRYLYRRTSASRTRCRVLIAGPFPFPERAADADDARGFRRVSQLVPSNRTQPLVVALRFAPAGDLIGVRELRRTAASSPDSALAVGKAIGAVVLPQDPGCSLGP